MSRDQSGEFVCGYWGLKGQYYQHATLCTSVWEGGKCYIGFHVQLENKSSFLNRLGGKVTSDLRNNRWFGVRGSILFGSLDTGVMGRLFMMLST